MKSRNYTKNQNNGDYSYTPYPNYPSRRAQRRMEREIEKEVTRAARKNPVLFIVIAAVLLIAALVYLYFTGAFDSFFPKEEEKAVPVSKAAATVHFIDVGQGDSIMFSSDDGCIVVDVGPVGSAKNTVDYISSYTEAVDYLVISHSHDDHFGGVATLLNTLDVRHVIMTDAPSKSTSIYSNMLTALENSSAEIIPAEAGNSYSVGGFDMELLGPVTEYNGNANDYSIVCKVTYGDVSFLCTGDSETPSEKEYVARYGDKLKSNVLKLAHHGSSSSTSEEFFNAVNPDYAIISCGKGNSYGHPHRETLELLKKHRTPYYRTDEVGTVVFSTDGANLAYVDPAASGSVGN